MAFILIYIGIGLCVAYGESRYYGCLHRLADWVIDTVSWPIVFLDKDLTSAMYEGWGK